MEKAGCVVILEGNIGVGKSTMGKTIQKRIEGSIYFAEPFDIDLLNLYLSDTSKYAFTFQLYILSKRGEIYRKARELANQGKKVIVDRSMIGDFSFAHMFREQKIISEKEWNTFLILWEKEIGRVEPPDLTIFLRASTKTLLERIKKRGIPSEIESYTEEYLDDLTRNYNYAMKNCDPKPMNKVIDLDWEVIEEKKIDSIIERIQSLIE